MLRLITTLFAIAAHILAFALFTMEAQHYSLPPRWTVQFIILLAISLLLAVVLAFSLRPGLAWFALSIRGIILFLISIHSGGDVGIKLALLSVLILEANSYGSLQGGLLYTAVVTPLVALQRRVVVWGVTLPGPNLQSEMLFFFYSGLIAVISFILNFQRNRQISMKELKKMFNEATVKLAETNMQLQEYAVAAEMEATMKERKRLARELHDTIAYSLTNLVMMLEAGLDLAGRRKVLREHLERTRDQAKNGLDDVHRSLQALRPVELTEVTGLPSIQRLVNIFNNATHIAVTLNTADVPNSFGRDADLVVYRLVQEGVTNALRHGLASEIEVNFSRQNTGIAVQIRDNGTGTDELKEGYGLTGMRERLEQLGGYLQVFSEPGVGFILSAWLPLEDEQKA